jgi:hypothetical protein
MPTNYQAFVRSVIDTLEALGFVYMIGGSFASMYYSEPRTTVDIDIAIVLPLEEVGRLVDAFQALGYYVSHDAIIDAIIHEQPFNIIDAEGGYKGDFFLLIEPTELERSALARRRREVYNPDSGAETCFYSPEDVIIYKLKYYLLGRMQKHLRDIAAMLIVRGETLDFGYIQQWAKEIGADEVWQQLLAEYRRYVQE